MKKIFTVAVVILLAITTVFANGAKEETSSLDLIRVSHHPYIHGLPTTVAIDNGIYEANGLKPEVTMYGGGAAQNEAIASDAWDVGTTGLAGAVVGCIGYDMKVIGATVYDGKTIDIWVRPDSDLAKTKGQISDHPEVYGTADTWKGKKIICQGVSNCSLVLAKTLSLFGLTTKDVEVIDMTVAQAYPAFRAGEADAVALWAPFGYLAADQGWVKVSSAEAVGVDFYNLIIATDKAVKEKPELVKRWLKTYTEGVEVIRANQDKAPEWLYEFSMDEGITTNVNDCKKEIALRPFPTVEQQKDLMNNGGLLNMFLNFAQYMLEQGNITQESYDKLATGSFLDPQFINAL
ncbi:MAG: ABC transporter substrate-binding protein [Spirochaetales bacterium]|nr:ABC transporter substrate-binding protein [Spirochaetales bacterium]